MSEEEEVCPCELEDQQLEGNPTAEVTPKEGRVAEATVCDARGCDTGILLVRGTHIDFVSTEQVQKFGRHKLDPVKMPSDVRIKRDYVLVHDTTNYLLNPCDFYILRWRGGRGVLQENAAETDQALIDAQNYFGTDMPIRGGSVDIPEKGVRWVRVGKIAFIRYRRAGYEKPFEHEYATPVDLYDCQRPLAWRLPLPTGCVVDERGFVKP